MRWPISRGRISARLDVELSVNAGEASPSARLSARDGVKSLAVFLAIGVPLAAAECIGVEYGYALKVRSEVQDVVDRAVRAAARRLDGGGSVAQRALTASLDAQLRPHLRQLDFQPEVAAEHGMVALRVSLKVVRRMSAAFGNTAFHFEIEGQATPADASAHDEADAAQSEAVADAVWSTGVPVP